MALSVGRLVLGRAASVVVVVIGVTALTWLSVNALRPDLRAGDDRLIFVALGDYLQSAFIHFDFGHSATGGGRAVAEVIREGLPVDLALLLGGMAFGLLAGVAGGAYCAARPGAVSARALETVAALFMCAPGYVVGAGLLPLFGSGPRVGGGRGAAIPPGDTPLAASPLR